MTEQNEKVYGYLEECNKDHITSSKQFTHKHRQMFLNTLRHSVEIDDLDALQKHVEREPCPFDGNRISREVLASAVQYNRADMVTWALDKYTNCIDIVGNKHILLTVAVKNDYRDITKLLIEEYKRQSIEEIAYRISIEEAIQSHNAELLKLIIEYWSNGVEIQNLNTTFGRDEDCRQYLEDTKKLQEELGIDRWREAMLYKHKASEKVKYRRM